MASSSTRAVQDEDDEEVDEKPYLSENIDELHDYAEYHVDLSPSQTIPTSSLSSSLTAPSTPHPIISQSLQISDEVLQLRQINNSARQTIDKLQKRNQRLEEELRQAKEENWRIKNKASCDIGILEEKYLEAEDTIAKFEDLLKSRKSWSSGRVIPIVGLRDEDDVVPGASRSLTPPHAPINLEDEIAVKVLETEEIGDKSTTHTDTEKLSHKFDTEKSQLQVALIYCICGKTYMSKQRLRGHINYMKAKPEFHCNICEARFKFPCYLCRHLKGVHKLGNDVVKSLLAISRGQRRKRSTKSKGKKELLLKRSDDNDVNERCFGEVAGGSISRTQQNLNRKRSQFQHEASSVPSDKFVCACGNKYRNKSGLQKHLEHFQKKYNKLI